MNCRTGLGGNDSNEKQRLNRGRVGEREELIERRSDLAEEGFDELYDGYQALGEVIVESQCSEVTYEMGYLDGWADAMHHFGWAYAGKPVKAKKAFPLFRARGTRSLARDVLKKRRAKRV